MKPFLFFLLATATPSAFLWADTLSLLPSTSTVSGTVFSGGVPKPKVRLDFYRNQNDERPISFAVSDSSGKYAAGDIPFGKIYMKVSNDERPVEWYRFDVKNWATEVNPKLEGDAEKLAKDLRNMNPSPMAPIDNLYKAWREKSLENYKAQWAANAKRWENGKESSLDAVYVRRAHQFDKLAVEHVAFTVISIVKERETYVVKTKYTFRFKTSDAKVFENSGFDLFRVSNTGEKWQIVENRDDAL